MYEKMINNIRNYRMSFRSRYGVDPFEVCNKIKMHPVTWDAFIADSKDILTTSVFLNNLDLKLFGLALVKDTSVKEGEFEFVLKTE